MTQLTCILTALALNAVAADDAPKQDDKKEKWDVTAAHGPTHDVSLSLDEGTWMSVSVRGDTILFDLLGDLWSVPLAGGEATRLTSDAAWDGQPRFSPDGSRIAYVSDRSGNEQLWIMDVGGEGPGEVFTDEGVARLTQPVWDPSGDWIVARKRTIDTRSIGVTELWQYHLDGGKGIQLTKLDEHPHAGEQDVHEREIFFSSRNGRFEYNHNPTAGLWQIIRYDRETGDTRAVARGSGSASRPLLAPDGRSLVFISRDRTKTLLEVLDLPTGKRRTIADWLSGDLMEGFALHATYPTMDFTDDGDLVLWSQGKLWRVTLDGIKTEIPFTANGTWRLHDVERWPIEIPDEITPKVIRWASRSERGAIAFSALGALWIRTDDGEITRLSEGTGYAPRWSPDGEDLAWVSWSDTDGGALHLHPGKGKPEVLPIEGQVVNPAWSEDGEQIVVLRGVGGTNNPDLGSEGWYEMVALTRNKKGWDSHVITRVDNRGATQRAPKLHVHDGRVWWFEDRYDKPRTPSSTVVVSIQLDGKDKRDHLNIGGSEESAISPDFKHIAYRQGHQLHVAAMPPWSPNTVAVAGGDVPSEKVTKIVGDWLDWSSDSKTITWTEGNTFKWLEIEGLLGKKDDKDKDKDNDDKDAKGEGLVEDEKIQSLPLHITLPRAIPETVLALTGARVISMNGDEVLEDATVVITGDRITAVGGPVPAGADVIDVTGKTIIPGLVDVHAHLHFSAADILPEQEWRYMTALDFGVTTVQDPSASTDLVFTQSERVEAGFMKGPRVFSTGGVLYGALSNDGAEAPNEDSARAHVRRMKAVGARSVKVYQQSQRERRQWFVQACNEEHILCVPEGGGDLWMNLGMVADGFHAIEHSLNVAPLYADVRSFFAASHNDASFGTAYTQTLLVAYGGLSGENYFLQHHNPLNNERLQRHFPRRQLDQKLWRHNMMIQDDDWRFQETARDGAGLATDGTLVTLGAHGQLQGMGAHWELWALGGPGAMSPHEALRAGTLSGARYMGLDHQLGSIEVGKLADLIILNSNPLDDLHNSADIALVIKNGEVFE